jgi:anaerobic magnesium-protoporphyrin IX monomethyl ester cyclase
MRVALIQTPWSDHSGGPLKKFAQRWVSNPPLGLLYLSSCLEENGHQVDVYDLEAEYLTPPQLCERLKKDGVQLIGITATTPVYFITVAYIEYLKVLGLPIVLGGPHITALETEATTGGPEVELPDAVDYAITHEGEYSLVQLIAALQAGDDLSEIHGLMWRDGDRLIRNEPRMFIENLDALPYPDRRKLNPLLYRFEVPIKGMAPVANMTLTRGCPYLCAFCGEPFNGGRKLRMRDPKSMVDEMETILELGVNHVWMCDSTLTANRKLLIGFSEEMIRRKVPMTFEGHTRANLVDPELLGVMKEAGLTRLAFGLESVDPYVLKLMEKEIKPEEVKKAVRLTTQMGIRATVGTMMGNAGDTRETILKTAWFVRSIPEINYAPNAIACPLPGTPLRRQAEQGVGGLKLLDPDYSKLTRYSGGVMEVNGMSPRYLLRLQRLALIIMHSTPRKLVYIIMHFGFFNLLGVLWSMLKSEFTVRVKGYDPVMREVADQNTTLANLGLGPIKSKAVRRAERNAEKAEREAERRLLEAQPLVPGAEPALMFKMVDSSEASPSSCGTSRPSLTGKTAHALNQRMRSQPQDAPQSVAHPMPHLQES